MQENENTKYWLNLPLLLKIIILYLIKYSLNYCNHYLIIQYTAFQKLYHRIRKNSLRRGPAALPQESLHLPLLHHVCLEISHVFLHINLFPRCKFFPVDITHVVYMSITLHILALSFSLLYHFKSTSWTFKFSSYTNVYSSPSTLLPILSKPPSSLNVTILKHGNYSCELKYCKVSIKI